MSISLCCSKGALEPALRPGEPPACKDFLKGECRRGAQCKFRHLTKREFERELGYCTQSPPHQLISEMQPQLQPQLQPQIQQPPPQPPHQTQPQPPPPPAQLQHPHPPITMVSHTGYLYCFLNYKWV